ncbi:HupE/UreJ family protein [Phenylobacterium sp.]|uniref:HupE/UreJ family protein n=1 Tax=Phenylobacterium sp. TaxID=1871053 RepID=UPI001225C39B|nr:HupE/UreJ family protein [Phenylobacterium sp.]THD56005.1 MAG: HupE/UreJ family protein [Phenylobacterium sp.]
MRRRNVRAAVWLVSGLVLALLLVARPAAAHTRSESHSVWEINGADVDLAMTIPVPELLRLGPGGAAPSDEAVKAYLSARVYPIAAGRRCALVPPVETLSAAPGYRKYDFTFRCPVRDELQIRSAAFFDVVPSHTNFAEIQDATTGAFAEQLITNEHQTVAISGKAAGGLKSASFFEFVRMGVMHIFTGVDHMSFLLGLVLISRRLRDLVFVVSGFTIGHSLTLALAVTGVIRPHPEFIDALVALTIALIGAENLAEQTHKPLTIAVSFGVSLALMALGSALGFGELPGLLLLGAGLFTSNYLMISGRLADPGRFRMMITLVFGLIHGFGFASNLLEMQLPTGRLAELLVGFNLGVEIGQLTLVLGVTGLVFAVSKLKLATPRAITVDIASSFLVGLGVFWFVTRSYR